MAHLTNQIPKQQQITVNKQRRPSITSTFKTTTVRYCDDNRSINDDDDNDDNNNNDTLNEPSRKTSAD